MDVVTWEEEVELERRQKNRFFALHPQSPLSEDDQLQFAGLDYFPADPKYRFEVELERHENAEVISIEDTTGGTREMTRAGEFRFEVDGVACTLQAYRSDPLEERLFVPFRDRSNGEETYPAGRHLDLEPDRSLTDDGSWIVDLNRAYNPWCAYSEAYACPFVLPENWLKVRIAAGERAFRLGKQ